MSEKVLPALENLSDGKQFPPVEFRHDEKSGEIPWKVFVEQALIEDAEIRPYWQRQCKYAFAPWAMKAENGKKPGYEDFYCSKHGFHSSQYSSWEQDNTTAKVVKDCFAKKCREHGIEPGAYERIMARFDPDPENIGHFGFTIKSFLQFYLSFGPVPFLLLQFFAALAILLVAKRLFCPTMALSTAVTALAALWLGLHAVYLGIFEQIMLEGWGARYIRFPGPILGLLNLTSLALLPFFVYMLIQFKNARKSVAPLVALIFACVPTILIVNVISSFLAFWAFVMLCIDAKDSADTIKKA